MKKIIKSFFKLFLTLSLVIMGIGPISVQAAQNKIIETGIVVVGSGLAGSSTAVSALLNGLM